MSEFGAKKSRAIGANSNPCEGGVDVPFGSDYLNSRRVSLQIEVPLRQIIHSWSFRRPVILLRSLQIRPTAIPNNPLLRCQSSIRKFFATVVDGDTVDKFESGMPLLGQTRIFPCRAYSQSFSMIYVSSLVLCGRPLTRNSVGESLYNGQWRQFCEIPLNRAVAPDGMKGVPRR